jgi:hypothetical protein
MNSLPLVIRLFKIDDPMIAIGYRREVETSL